MFEVICKSRSIISDADEIKADRKCQDVDNVNLSPNTASDPSLHSISWLTSNVSPDQRNAARISHSIKLPAPPVHPQPSFGNLVIALKPSDDELSGVAQPSPTAVDASVSFPPPYPPSKPSTPSFAVCAPLELAQNVRGLDCTWRLEPRAGLGRYVLAADSPVEPSALPGGIAAQALPPAAAARVVMKLASALAAAAKAPGRAPAPRRAQGPAMPNAGQAPSGAAGAGGSPARQPWTPSGAWRTPAAHDGDSRAATPLVPAAPLDIGPPGPASTPTAPRTLAPPPAAGEWRQSLLEHSDDGVQAARRKWRPSASAATMAGKSRRTLHGEWGAQ